MGKGIELCDGRGWQTPHLARAVNWESLQGIYCSAVAGLGCLGEGALDSFGTRRLRIFASVCQRGRR